MRLNQPLKTKTWRPRQRGQALVPVIFVLLIFTVLALSFAGTTQREISASNNFARQTERSLAGQGAIQYAMAALAQSSNNGATYGVLTPSSNTDANGWMQIGDAYVKIEVIDTGAFLSLNGADKPRLSRLPVFRDNSDLVDAILDWKGQGNEANEQGGAKLDYYLALPTPYNCKEAAFDSVEELLLVKGMSPQILYGSASGTPVDTDQNQGGASGYRVGGAGSYGTRQATPEGGGLPGPPPANGGQNPNQNNPQDNDPDADDPAQFQELFQNSQIPLVELLVPSARERNVSADGKKRININTAKQEQLTEIGLTPEQVQSLVAAKSGNNNNPPGASNGPGGPPPGDPGGGPPAPDRKSRQNGGNPGQGGGGNPGQGGNNPGQGGGDPYGGNNNQGGASGSLTSLADLISVPGFTRRTIQQIADKITFDGLPYRENVVNINTAPAEVLATVPGMDSNALQQILEPRQKGQAFQTIGDLFSLKGIRRVQYQRMLPYLCTKSSSYVVRVQVRMSGQLSVFAVSALVEMTAKGPRLLQWREVPRQPGWTYWQPAPKLPPSGNGQAPVASEEPIS